MSPLVEQAVRSRRRRACDSPGHGAHLAVEVLRHLGGDQRARALARLDHDRHPAQGGHDPVARGEHPAPRLGARRELSHHHPSFHDPLIEPRGPRWIRNVHAGAEHRDRQAACVERSLVSAGVDSHRHPADHREAGRGDLTAELPGDLAAVAGSAGATRRWSRCPRGEGRRDDRGPPGRRSPTARRRGRRAHSGYTPSWRQVAQAPESATAASSLRGSLAAARSMKDAACDGAIARASSSLGSARTSRARLPGVLLTAVSMCPASEPTSQALRRHSPQARGRTRSVMTPAAAASRSPPARARPRSAPLPRGRRSFGRASGSGPSPAR